jgi:transcriptional regulator with AAA-type ATPase domain
MLEQTAVLLVARLPIEPRPRRYFPEPDFSFGEPDAEGFVGESAEAWALRDELGAAAASGEHVLVTGESGAGKELGARLLAPPSLHPPHSGAFAPAPRRALFEGRRRGRRIRPFCR